MNGNVEGVRTCAHSGLSVNDRDDDSWAPLHYASWYDMITLYKLCSENIASLLLLIAISGCLLNKI